MPFSQYDGGFILLHRKVLQKNWLRNHKLWAFWCWCLLKASHKEHEQIVGYQEVNLLPGQFVFGRRTAATELGMSEREIRTALRFLRTVGNVTIKTTNKYSILSIVNWDTYQHPAPGKRPAGHRANDRQGTTNNNGNNENKEKNTAPGFQPVLDFYFQKTKEIKGFRPELPRKDFSILSAALWRYGQARVENIILFFLDSEKADKHVSLSAALTAMSLRF